MDSSANFPVRDYNLAATLNSGQAFRWKSHGDTWEGVIHGRWVSLRQDSPNEIQAATSEPQPDWHWLSEYLGLDADHSAMLATFPNDEPLREAVAHCPGLRLLRQEPWECLASFILSSTKQIVQIQQCVELLCASFGEAIRPGRTGPWPRHAFPAAERIATTTELQLRACKMGFRAKYLLAAARLVDSGRLDLARLATMPVEDARAELMQCPGVGRKIADCTLLFSCGFDEAFPIDVWVERALQQLYFPRRKAKRNKLEHLAATHFGPHAGLAQQYLFHYLRTGGHIRARPQPNDR